jgi:small-conductance mechanosensitive channel
MRRTSYAVAALAALLSAGAAGQVPGFPSLVPDPLRPAATVTRTPSAPRAGSAESREATVERLRKQIAAVNEARTQAAPVPAGISEGEVDDLVETQGLLVMSSEVQLRALDELDQVRAAREAARAANRDWTAFDQPPPYSILMVDELREAADGVRARLVASERSAAHLRLELERYAVDVRRADEALRRAQEVLDRANADERSQAAWRQDLAQLRLQVVAGRGATTQLMLQVGQEDKARRQAELELLERKIRIAERETSFTEADLAKAHERLAVVERSLRTEQKSLAQRLAPRTRERDEARKALERLHAQPGASEEATRVAEARLRAADAWIGALSGERDVLDAQVTATTEMARIWEARRTALHAAEPGDRAAATERIGAASARLARWVGYVENVVQLQRAQLLDVEAGMTRASTKPAEVAYEQDRAAALRRLLSQFERAKETMRATSVSLDRWVADLERERGTRELAVRLEDRWYAAKSVLERVWNFELFAVEDTTIVDGTEVKTSRGVTVGKSVGAFLLFAVGYWLAAAVSRRLERRMIDRGFDARRVRNTRRWALAAVSVLLALFTLNLARIPLTVFAFLGGALAIGVGFGTQTIIRNFISGIIVLGERRIQIGDIIEVDGVTGTVTSVDLRSSTVLGFDGVETSVPNAVLIENKVTNWTHSDKRVRRTVRVGVRYGSPLREVADLLEDCAKRHGLVLQDPAPMVIFEDFGSDTQVFGLYFWVEIKPAVSALQVASDLRHMIARSFAERGIVVAFPQRDIHIDAPQPLRIELVDKPAAARAPRAA